MAVTIKTSPEIEKMRVAGRLAADAVISHTRNINTKFQGI